MTIDKIREDSPDPVRLGGIGRVVAEGIAQKTGLQARATVLGHLQRGGSPCAFDRVLATRFGHKACELIVSGEYGKMPALQGNKIVAVSLKDAVSKLKTVDPESEVIAAARAVGTCFGDESGAH